MKINTSNIMQKTDNSISLYDIESSCLITLSGVAIEIYVKIEKGLNKKQITKYVSETYDISETKAQKDVDSTINKLKKYCVIYD